MSRARQQHCSCAPQHQLSRQHLHTLCTAAALLSLDPQHTIANSDAQAVWRTNQLERATWALCCKQIGLATRRPPERTCSNVSSVFIAAGRHAGASHALAVTSCRYCALLSTLRALGCSRQRAWGGEGEGRDKAGALRVHACAHMCKYCAVFSTLRALG